jgi:Mn2+/Fe2+ NRAMP family transporter
MGCVQFMCARIGMVTGRGLAGTLRLKFPKPLIAVATFALFIANTINIGADLSGMADSAEMLTGLKSFWFVPLFGVAITAASIWCRYEQIARILKWLALALMYYIVTGFLINPDWSQVLWSTIIPTLPKGHAMWGTLVAILGTTISPYLFYWKSSQEVEEKKSKGRKKIVDRRGATRQEILDRKLDVGSGTFASNFVMYFIILTTALALHKSGATEIETSRQAAEALRPLAGNSRQFFSLRALSAPTFSPSRHSPDPPPTPSPKPSLGGKDWTKASRAPAASTPCSSPRWLSASRSTSLKLARSRLSIGRRFSTACSHRFYWSAIIACDRTIMQKQPSSMISRIVADVTALLMFGAAIGMFVF